MQLLHSFHLVIINCWLSKRLSIRKINANCNQRWNKSHTKSIRLSRTQYQDRNWWRWKPNCTVSTWQKFSNWCSLVLYKDICKITSLDDYNRITIGDDVYTVFLHTWKWNLKKVNIVLNIVNMLIENGPNLQTLFTATFIII